MYLRCTKQVNAGYIVHFLAMYLRCTSSVHHPLPPVQEVPSVLDEPIVLHRQGDGPAPIGPSPLLYGSSSASSSSSGLNTLVKNGEPIPIIYLTLELIQVRCQRARRALGSPTSRYSPYSSDTESRKSPHRLSSIDHGAEIEGRVGDE